MLKIKQNQKADLYISSTRFSQEDEYVFFATHGTVTQTLHIPITRLAHTLRYDKYELDFTATDIALGKWDYIILPSGSYNGNYTDVILNHKDDVVETGKMLVVDDGTPVEKTAYAPSVGTRKQYQPE